MTRLPNQEKEEWHIFYIAVEVLIHHPSLLVYTNCHRKDHLLLKTEPPARTSDMPQKINSNPLHFRLSRTHRELPVRWHAFPCRIATKNLSACQQQLGNQLISQWKVCPSFAPIKQNLCLVKVDDLPKHPLVKNQLVNSDSNGNSSGGGGHGNSSGNDNSKVAKTAATMVVVAATAMVVARTMMTAMVM
jgi:hypothetical protein